MTSIPTAFETNLSNVVLTRSDTPVVAQSNKVSQEFDAIILRNMLESILPQSTGATFGGGTAGGMWRSMMADKIAGVLSESNVLGVSIIGKNGAGAQ